MTIAITYIPPGSIGTYLDLVGKVSSWMDRDDLADRVPDFIALHEARLNRVLRAPEMEVYTVLPVASETVPLPTDLLQIRSIAIEGQPDRPLRAMAPGGISQTFGGSAGCPSAYSVVGHDLLLAPPPAQSVNLALVYWQRLPSLSQVVPTNWLLDRHPDIYLWGALLQAEVYLANDERIGLWKAAHDEALAELVKAGHQARWGSGPLVPNTVHQVRGARC